MMRLRAIALLRTWSGVGPAACVAVLTLGRVGALDLASVLEDEPNYRAGGLGPGFTDSAQLYETWYWLAGRVASGDNIFLVSWGALLAANLALCYALMRLLGAGRLAATLALVIIGSVGLWDVRPWVSLFSAMLVMGSLVAALGAAERWRLPLLACGLVGATFARPELALGASILIALCGLRRETVLPMAVLAAIVLSVGSPLAAGRTAVAFGQHYAWNLSYAGERFTNHWLEWETPVRRDFGTLPGPIGALRANPSRFAWHVASNLSHSWLLGQLFAPKSLPIIIRVLFALSLASAAAVGLWRVRRHRERRFVGAAVAALGLPAAASIVVIHPRAHYGVPLAMLILVLAAVGLASRGKHLAVERAPKDIQRTA